MIAKGEKGIPPDSGKGRGGAVTAGDVNCLDPMSYESEMDL